jgi:hypothetical protein
MVAGPKSAVSIDGTIVRIGEVINGHRLVEVHEQTATFVKNRKRVTLSLRAMEAAPAAASTRKDERAAPARADTQTRQDAPANADDRVTAERDERKAK